MHNQQQKNYFLEVEADQWYERNKQKLSEYDPSGDHIISLLKQYKSQPGSVLEIGCSEGYRLNGIQQYFPGTVVHGIDPSAKAIEAGKEKYTAVQFHHGTADDLGSFATAQFDVVIMGFVFYVIDRGILLQCMAEADRVLQNGGLLVILDFFSEKPVRRKYQHIESFEAYSYKQCYDEMFTATHLYQLLHRSTYDHKSMQEDIAAEFQELVSLSVLKKSLDAAYR